MESDPARARAIARPTIKFYLGLPNYTNNLLRLGFERDELEGDGSDRLIDALVAWGDPERVAARIAEHWEAGADHVAVQFLTASEPRHSGPLPRAEWKALAEAIGPAAAR